MVAPLNGIVQPGPTNTSLSFRPVGMSTSFLELVMYNVVPVAHILNTSTLVQAGAAIATVIGQSQCSSGSANFLHLVMRSVTSSQELIDPTQFLSDSSRDSTVGEDWTNSGTYSIFVRNDRRRDSTLRVRLQSQSTAIARTSQQIAIPTLATGSSAPATLTSNQSAIDAQLPVYNFASMVAVPTAYPLTDALWPAMNTDVADVISSPQPPSTLASVATVGSMFTVSQFQSILSQARLDNSAATVNTAMEALAQRRSQLVCEHLPAASSTHLQQKLQLLGISSTGTRQELLTRLQGASNSGEFHTPRDKSNIHLLQKDMKGRALSFKQ